MRGYELDTQTAWLADLVLSSPNSTEFVPEDRAVRNGPWTATFFDDANPHGILVASCPGRRQVEDRVAGLFDAAVERRQLRGLDVTLDEYRNLMVAFDEAAENLGIDASLTKGMRVVESWIGFSWHKGQKWAVPTPSLVEEMIERSAEFGHGDPAPAP